MSSWRYRGKIIAEMLGFMIYDVVNVIKSCQVALFVIWLGTSVVSAVWIFFMCLVQAKEGNMALWHWWVWWAPCWLALNLVGFFIWWVIESYKRAKRRLQ